VNDELKLLRAFRAQDGTVDAASAQAARTQLLGHIAGAGNASARRARGWRFRVTPAAVAIALAIGVIIAVGAVFLGLRTHPAHRRVPATPHGKGAPPALHNVAPAGPPKLPGQFYCNADLSRPGAIPGLGGRRSGVIVVNTASVNGVNESPFSITAKGLPPSVRAGEYAVWILQVTGLTSTAAPIPGAKPRLLGVIVPGVPADGRLAASGVLPSGVNGGDYLIRITRQVHSSVTRPGRTVLKGVGQL